MRKNLLLKLREQPSTFWVLFEVNCLRNLATAVLTAILPVYFRRFVQSDAAVAGIFFIGYAAATLSTYYSSYLIERLKKRKALLFALMGFTIIFGLFTLIQHTAILFVLFAMYQFLMSLFITDISLYIKHYSDYRMIAENTGKMGAFGNIGWLVGPLLGGLIAEKFGFEAVFIFSSMISLIALVTFFFIRLSKEEVYFTHTRSLYENIGLFFKNSNLRKSYFNNLGLGFIYAIWDFLPLLMLQIGASIAVIGMTKTLMGVTQAVFEFPIGQMADRETGERRVLIVGYILAALFTLLLGFTVNLRLFITFFFIAAAGSSFIEMTRDSYFYRQMPEKEVELISVYQTSNPFGYLIGQGFGIVALLLVPLSWWFVIGGVLGLFFIWNAYRLKELKT